MSKNLILALGSGYSGSGAVLEEDGAGGMTWVGLPPDWDMRAPDQILKIRRWGGFAVKSGNS